MKFYFKYILDAKIASNMLLNDPHDANWCQYAVNVLRYYLNFI